MSDSISSGTVPPTVIDTSSLHIPNAVSPSLWDRVSHWASDNKAAVYTIAGVTVVVSAGAIYYFNSQPAQIDYDATAERKRAKKDKKKAKKEAEKSEKAPAEKKAEEGNQ